MTFLQYGLNAALGIGLGLSLACSPAAVSSPNLVLITVDTLRPDRLSCYGGPPDLGTSICGLADAGFRYAWALSPAPSTAPAIASILTSRYPSFHGVTQFASTHLAEEATTLAEVFSQAGYATAAFVANPVVNRARNLQQGFDIYDDRMTRRELNRRQVSERQAELNTDVALAWARVVEPPWLMWIHFQDPHGPYEPPGAPPISDEPGSPSLPALQDQSGREGIPAYQRLAGVYSTAAYEARYLSEIRYLDHHVGRLIAGIDALPSPAGTGIVLTADHGEALGEDDYWFAHGHSLSLDQIWVPLFWRPPDPGEARVITTPSSTIDIAPTMLAAAGIPPPAEFQGRELPDDDSSSGARPLFAEHRVRAATVAGRVYYGRDRIAIDEPLKDRISGGWLLAMPPRTARLPHSGRLPRYEVLKNREGAPALEELLASFLENAGERVEPEASDLSPETREELRALGYLE